MKQSTVESHSEMGMGMEMEMGMGLVTLCLLRSRLCDVWVWDVPSVHCVLPVPWIYVAMKVCIVVSVCTLAHSVITDFH